MATFARGDPPGDNADIASSEALRRQSQELRQQSRTLLTSARDAVERSARAIARGRAISAAVATCVKRWKSEN